MKVGGPKPVIATLPAAAPTAPVGMCDTIAALGNRHVRTPNLDRLVKGGFAFTHAFCMGSTVPAVCVPSRAMLLTGRTLYRAPVTIPARLPTWPGCVPGCWISVGTTVAARASRSRPTKPKTTSAPISAAAMLRYGMVPFPGRDMRCAAVDWGATLGVSPVRRQTGLPPSHCEMSKSVQLLWQ